MQLDGRVQRARHAQLAQVPARPCAGSQGLCVPANPSRAAGKRVRISDITDSFCELLHCPFRLYDRRAQACERAQPSGRPRCLKQGASSGPDITGKGG